MSRLNKAQEIIELASLFQNSFCGLTIEDIAEHFGCSRRSAERMKSILFDMYPTRIEEVPSCDKKKRWRFVKGTINGLISFTPDEFVMLEHLKEGVNDINIKNKIDGLIGKIKTIIPQKNIRSLDTDISAILESEGLAIRQHSKIKTDNSVLEKLRQALLSFKKIKFLYPVCDDIKEIILNPYGIIISDKYYLVGFNEYVDDYRMYRINKIKDLEIINEYYEKDENFSLKKYSENSFGVYQENPLNITLEFNKCVAEDVMNYHFHPTQKVKRLKNGNIEVKFKAGGTQAICWELFKWSSDVKIKQPVELKNMYKEYLENVLSKV